MAKQAAHPKKKRPKRELPANAKLEDMEIHVETRSYQIWAYFDSSGDGIDFELKIGKQSDLGKEIGRVIEKIRNHPKGKV